MNTIPYLWTQTEYQTWTFDFGADKFDDPSELAGESSRLISFYVEGNFDVVRKTWTLRDNSVYLQLSGTTGHNHAHPFQLGSLPTLLHS